MNILAIDDHALFREGLGLMLQRLTADVTVHEVESPTAAAEWAQQGVAVDMVLLDIHMPGLCGDRGVNTVRALFPQALLVMVSGEDDHGVIESCLKAGARAFIHKSESPASMLNQIRALLQLQVQEPAPASAQSPGPQVKLSERQGQVLSSLCEGLANKEIAQRLDMSVNTVRVHLYDIFKLLNVNTRTQAVLQAKLQGLA